MTKKQIVFSALILGAINTFGLATEQSTSEPIPALLFIHYFEQAHGGYATQEKTHSDVTLMTKERLNRFDAMKKTAYDNFTPSIKCPCSIKGLPSEIDLYNPENPYDDTFNPCEVLNITLLKISKEELNIVAQHLSSAK
jgi:hypothetical protein